MEALEFCVNWAKDHPFAVNVVAVVELLFAVLSPTKPSLKDTDRLYCPEELNDANSKKTEKRATILLASFALQ